MSNVIIGKSRDEVFDVFDNYAYERKAEVDRHDLGPNTGMLKSYVLETAVHDGVPDVQGILNRTEWRAEPLGPDQLYYVYGRQGLVGYAEPLGGRFIALHSYGQTEPMDREMRRVVMQLPELDFLWLSGEVFMLLWRHYILPRSPSRFVSLKCEQMNSFESHRTQDIWYDDERERLDPEPDGDDEEVSGVDRGAISSAFTERAQRLEQILSKFQAIYPAFRAIKMLRVPSEERGGYDLWSWGKMTYRAPNFREGRSQLLEITRLYERVTAAIEEAVWLNLEPVSIPDSTSLQISGAPVLFEFSEPLPDRTFQNLVSTTFEQGRGPLRLWGNPIRLGERKVHVYGLDLHLWQRLYMELTPKRFLFVLPRGTCGNTVHRLMTNIQRFVDPTVKMTIGNTTYAEMFENALFSREVVSA